MGLIFENAVQKTKEPLTIVELGYDLAKLGKVSFNRAFPLKDGKIIAICNRDIFLFNQNLEKITNFNLGEGELANDIIEIEEGIVLSCGVAAKLIQLNSLKIIQSLNFATPDHKTNLKKLSNGEIVVSASGGKVYFCSYKNKKLELENEFSINVHKPLSVYESNNNKEIMILDYEY